MDGLQAVADVGQRAGDDDAHRVVEVRDAHLVLDADGSDVAQVVGHVVALLRSWIRCQLRSMMGRSAGGTSTPRPVNAAAAAGAREVDGRRRGGGRRRAVSRSSARGRRQLRERVADDPGAMAVVGGAGGRGLRAEERRGRGQVDAPPASGAPTTRAFWTSGVASPMRSRGEREAVADDLRACGRRRGRRAAVVAIVEPTRRRSQRDGE